MEANLEVEMLNDIKQDSYRFGTLIGDDDSTTMAIVRIQVDHNIEKWSDINHHSTVSKSNKDLLPLLSSSTCRSVFHMHSRKTRMTRKVTCI